MPSTISAQSMRAQFLIASLAITWAASPLEAQLQVGKPAPEFLLPRVDNGEAVSLAQFRGRKLLLIQFASW